MVPEAVRTKDAWDVIALKPGDEVVGAVDVVAEDAELVFITSDAQLLRMPASSVRPQGRAPAAWPASSWPPMRRWCSSAPSSPDDAAEVVTVAGSSDALPGTAGASVKVSAFAEYPRKGRATGGVRCQRFLKGEDELTLGWAGQAPARAARTARRCRRPSRPSRPSATRSGMPAINPIAAVAGPV